jgi:hypothetical protein
LKNRGRNGGGNSGGGKMTGSDQYYALTEKIDEARSQRRYIDALNLSLEVVKWLPQLVKETKREPGGWDIKGSSALGYACHYLGVLRRRDDLIRIKTLLNSVPELREWIDEVDFGLRGADLMDKIESILLKDPGFVQAKLGKILGENGREVSNLMHYAEQIGVVRREKAGKDYRLYLQNESTIGH